jgi:hypothetical protein
MGNALVTGIVERIGVELAHILNEFDRIEVRNNGFELVDSEQLTAVLS